MAEGILILGVGFREYGSLNLLLNPLNPKPYTPTGKPFIFGANGTAAADK